MNAKIFISFLVLVFVGISLNAVFAKNSKHDDSDIPEITGTYDVPGRPDMKVKVFVHNAKPAKPGNPPAPTPALTCGLNDLDSTAIVNKEAWKLPSTFTYRLNLGTVPSSVGAGNLAKIVSDSFNVWTSAILGKVTISQGPNTNVAKKGLDGQNIIAWGRLSGSVLGVTYIWYNNQGIAVDIDTIMNKSVSWMWSTSSTNCAYEGFYDAQNIMVHEIGHWFGLDDHYTSEYTENTMYGYGAKTEVKKNTPTTGDTIGINSIY